MSEIGKGRWCYAASSVASGRSFRLRARVSDETLTLSIWAVSFNVFPWLRSCRAASVFDGVIVRGRPPSRPRDFAAAKPALVRSDNLDRSYSAREANMSNMSFPWALVVSSHGSASDRNPTPRRPSTVTMSAKSAVLRPSLVRSVTVRMLPGCR